MANKSKNNSAVDREHQLPPGISPKDWAKTPASVRKLVTLLIEPTQESIRDPENRFPFLITLLINLGIVAILASYLEGKVAFRCITPRQVSPLSIAIISLIPLHLIWRNIYALIPPNLEETIKIGVVTVPLRALISFFNEMQLWKLSSRLLGLLLIIFLIIGAYLNLSPDSPFYIKDELSAIQGFSIRRLDKQSLEGLPVGGTLMIAASEQVFIEALFRNKAATTCTWFSKMSSQSSRFGCGIVLDQVSRTGPGTLTVLIQSACGTQDYVGLNIVVLPELASRPK